MEFLGVNLTVFKVALPVYVFISAVIIALEDMYKVEGKNRLPKYNILYLSIMFLVSIIISAVICTIIIKETGIFIPFFSY